MCAGIELKNLGSESIKCPRENNINFFKKILDFMFNFMITELYHDKENDMTHIFCKINKITNSTAVMEIIEI